MKALYSQAYRLLTSACTCGRLGITPKTSGPSMIFFLRAVRGSDRMFVATCSSSSDDSSADDYRHVTVVSDYTSYQCATVCR
jgi:hypothetical protein